MWRKRYFKLTERLPPLLCCAPRCMHGNRQGANASQAKDWFEDGFRSTRVTALLAADVTIKDKDEDGDGDGDENDKVSNAKESDVDPFIANIPSDLTIADCIVDVGGGVGKFKTIEEQNAYFAGKMLEMGREEDSADKENGWKLWWRLEAEEIDVYEREVAWYVSGKARDNPNRKKNETHETVLARARRSAPPRARWAGRP